MIFDNEILIFLRKIFENDYKEKNILTGEKSMEIIDDHIFRNWKTYMDYLVEIRKQRSAGNVSRSYFLSAMQTALEDLIFARSDVIYLQSSIAVAIDGGYIDDDKFIYDDIQSRKLFECRLAMEYYANAHRTVIEEMVWAFEHDFQFFISCEEMIDFCKNAFLTCRAIQSDPMVSAFDNLLFDLEYYLGLYNETYWLLLDRLVELDPASFTLDIADELEKAKYSYMGESSPDIIVSKTFETPIHELDLRVPPGYENWEP